MENRRRNGRRADIMEECKTRLQNQVPYTHLAHETTTSISTPFLCHRLAKIDALNEEVRKLREAKMRCQSEGLSAEERSAEMGKVLDAEQRTMDTLQWQLDKSRDKKVQADKSLHELDTQQVFNSKRLKGNTAQNNGNNLLYESDLL